VLNQGRDEERGGERERFDGVGPSNAAADAADAADHARHQHTRVGTRRARVLECARAHERPRVLIESGGTQASLFSVHTYARTLLARVS
jgi:hypothetical protein